MESLEHYNKDTSNNPNLNHPNPYPYTIENHIHSTQPTPTPQSNHTPPKSSPFIPQPSTSQPFIPSRPRPTAPSHPQIQFNIPLPPTSDIPGSRESFVTTSSSVGGIKDSAESVGKCSVENSFLRSHDFQDSVDSGSYIEQDSENDFDIDSEHYGDGSINNME
ncbi:hypothetical protein BKA69DRAFT_1101703 [Paraphysoderma sedebokerense]|nr:hypothetical protein BKA69DRAFT_1101703 [Paraphysoderma sedebokerense]